ncbi:MAG: hypothetical protein QXL85_08615 [Candidatus Bathyarchaeia archaeon]
MSRSSGASRITYPLKRGVFNLLSDSINIERLSSILHIAPYDMGIYQDFTVDALSFDGKKYNIILKRSGV